MKSRYVGGYPLGDKRNWIEVDPGIRVKLPGKSPDVMPDIEGFWEPGASEKIKGKFIDGRADLRAFERETGKRQIGDQISPVRKE